MSSTWVAIWVAWFVLTLVLFAVLEYRALTDKNERTPPLTAVIKKFVPRWVIAVVLGGFVFWFYDHLTP